MDWIKEFEKFLEESDVHNIGHPSLKNQLEEKIAKREGYSVSLRDYIKSIEPDIFPENYLCIVLGGKIHMDEFWEKIEKDWKKECWKLRETPQCRFIEFLKENRIEKRFKLYFKDFNSELDFDEMLANVNPTTYVSGSFRWSNTDEESDFWMDIHNKWIKNCTSRYRFKVEIKGEIDFESKEEARKYISNLYRAHDGHSIEITLDAIGNEESE